MEIEYKWDWPAELSAEALLAAPPVAPHIVGKQNIALRARYYDTPGGLLGEQRTGLRMRTENERSVCCLKVAVVGRDGCKVREEFEACAPDVRAGLRALRGTSAPAGLLDELLANELVVTCETDFTRCAVEFRAGELAAELALDEGRLGRQGRWQALREIELEHKGGPLEQFDALAQRLVAEFGLRTQPLSKLARALAV